MGPEDIKVGARGLTGTWSDFGSIIIPRVRYSEFPKVHRCSQSHRVFPSVFITYLSESMGSLLAIAELLDASLC